MKFKKFLPTSQLTRYPVVKRLVTLGFLFLLFQTMLNLLLLSRLPSLLPLFYSQSWGIAQLAKKTTLWLLPFLTTIVFILNLVLAHFLFGTEKNLSWALIITTVVFAFLILFTQIRIILLFL